MTDKHPGGRPSKYKKAYCAIIIDKMSEGWSVSEVAAHLDVSRQTIENWKKDHPEFLDAFTRAKAAEQSWWERTGRESLTADKFQTHVWAKSMQARFRDDYTETRRHEGHEGGPVTIKVDTGVPQPKEKR
jgi:hypothetical protein